MRTTYHLPLSVHRLPPTTYHLTRNPDCRRGPPPHLSAPLDAIHLAPLAAAHAHGGAGGITYAHDAGAGGVAHEGRQDAREAATSPCGAGANPCHSLRDALESQAWHTLAIATATAATTAAAATAATTGTTAATAATATAATGAPPIPIIVHPGTYYVSEGLLLHGNAVEIRSATGAEHTLLDCSQVRPTSPHLTSPHLTSPHLTSPPHTVPYFDLPCLALPYFALPYFALPCLT